MANEPTHFEALYPDDARFPEIEKVLSFVKAGNSTQVIGIPGVGRSNVLSFLAYNKAIRLKHLGENQKWFHFVMVNFSEIRNRSLFDAMKFLFLNLVDSLRERGMLEEYEAANAIFKASLEMHDELVLFQGLKRVMDLLAIEKELTIVFLFDRFEEYIPTLTPDFFGNLRVLRDRAKYRFSVVLSLNRPLEDLLEPTLINDFYEFVAGHYVYVSLFDEPGMAFRLQYIEKVTEKQLPEEDKAHILSLTGGHGRLVRLATETLLSREGNEQLSEEKLQAYLLEQKAIQAALVSIWKSFTPSEQQCLLDEAWDREDSDCTHLEKVDLLKDSKLTMPLFGAYIRGMVDEAALEKEKIVYDAATNEIKKGNLILSDSLTASEFRLLSYFLQNEEKIIGREEIIPIVWGDSKSTAGVTDQAIDQLIFRLRKKIEDDPNAPEHLTTVKGRGFKFTS